MNAVTPRPSVADTVFARLTEGGHPLTGFHANAGRPISAEHAARLERLPLSGAVPFVYATSVGADAAGIRPTPAGPPVENNAGVAPTVVAEAAPRRGPDWSRVNFQPTPGGTRSG